METSTSSQTTETSTETGSLDGTDPQATEGSGTQEQGGGPKGQQTFDLPGA